MAKFEAGKSGNPKGRPTKPNGRVVEYGFSAAQNMPDMPTATIPSELKTSNQDWINWGTDNLFPNALAQLNRKSPSHRGIINWKTIYLSGKGFDVGEEKGNFYDWIQKCNANGESLKSVIRKIIFDKNGSGNSFVELVVSKGKLSIYHKDFTTCRLGKDGKSVMIYGDWANAQSKKSEIKTIAKYPDWTADGETKRSILHIKSYEPEFNDYGVADWIAAMDAAGIVYKTNKWNISRLDNSFSSSGVLVVEGNINANEAKKMKTDFKTEFTGEKKQGKVMFIVKALGGGETKFTPFTSANEGEWLQLHKQAEQDLIVSHSWFRSLSGLATEGQLGNVQQIRSEYQIALNTVITEEQENLLDILRPIIKEFGKFDSEKLKFKNQIPLSIQDLLDPKLILTIDEQRKIFGFAEFEDGSGKSMLKQENNKEGGANG